MIREESHFRTDVRKKESAAGGSQSLHHTLLVVASRKTRRIHASVRACIFVYARVCVCMCVRVCAREYSRTSMVVVCSDPLTATVWLIGIVTLRKEMHRYTMSSVCMKWILAGQAPMSIALPGTTAVSIARPIASFLCLMVRALLQIADVGLHRSNRVKKPKARFDR